MLRKSQKKTSASRENIYFSYPVWIEDLLWPLFSLLHSILGGGGGGVGPQSLTQTLRPPSRRRHHLFSRHLGPPWQGYYGLLDGEDAQRRYQVPNACLLLSGSSLQSLPGWCLHPVTYRRVTGHAIELIWECSDRSMEFFLMEKRIFFQLRERSQKTSAHWRGSMEIVRIIPPFK